MLPAHLRPAFRRILSPHQWKIRAIFWLAAIGVGLAAALFALVARLADETHHQLYLQQPLLALALPPLGLALIAWLTRKVFLGTEGSGIPQAIAALSMHTATARNAVLSLRLAAGKILLTCMGLFSGASIGREGPTVHVGASIMHSLHHFHRFHDRHMIRALILAGGAAGISAAFNTPLAGIIFAIEEMGRSFESRSSSTLLIAVILAGITAVMILGDYTYFGRSTETLPVSQAWQGILACGIVGGLLGGLFASALIHGTRRLAGFARRHPVTLAFACGLLVSATGYLAQGATFGTGYEQAHRLVTGSGEADWAYPFYKMFATVVSYLSGIPGGIFAPSLSVGAGLGADIGAVLGIGSAAIVMLGMVGYFTGVVQTPITAFVIVMEMTDSSSMMLPLMATAIIARLVSQLVCPKPIYGALAEAYLQKTGKAG